MATANRLETILGIKSSREKEGYSQEESVQILNHLVREITPHLPHITPKTLTEIITSDPNMRLNDDEFPGRVQKVLRASGVEQTTKGVRLMLLYACNHYEDGKSYGLKNYDWLLLTRDGDFYSFTLKARMIHERTRGGAPKRSRVFPQTACIRQLDEVSLAQWLGERTVYWGNLIEFSLLKSLRNYCSSAQGRIDSMTETSARLEAVQERI